MSVVANVTMCQNNESPMDCDVRAVWTDDEGRDIVSARLISGCTFADAMVCVCVFVTAC